jgi:hypothetical protein
VQILLERRANIEAKNKLEWTAGRAIQSYGSVLHRLALKGGAIYINILIRFYYSFLLCILSCDFVCCLWLTRALNIEEGVIDRSCLVRRYRG